MKGHQMNLLEDITKHYRNDFPLSVSVSLPLDFGKPEADQERWEMRRWCKMNCSQRYAARWVGSRDAAKFDFECAQDAARFVEQWAR